MRDDHNFLGQLEGSVDSYDQHDLPKLDPFNSVYLNIVFAQDKWEDYSGFYASDHHQPTQHGDGLWDFEVHTSLPVGTEVTLSWEGPERAVANATLFDYTSNNKPSAASGSYTFTVTAPVHHFAWQQDSWRYSRDNGPIRPRRSSR